MVKKRLKKETETTWFNHMYTCTRGRNWLNRQGTNCFDSELWMLPEVHPVIVLRIPGKHVCTRGRNWPKRRGTNCFFSELWMLPEVHPVKDTWEACVHQRQKLAKETGDKLFWHRDSELWMLPEVHPVTDIWEACSTPPTHPPSPPPQATSQAVAGAQPFRCISFPQSPGSWKDYVLCDVHVHVQSILKLVYYWIDPCLPPPHQTRKEKVSRWCKENYTLQQKTPGHTAINQTAIIHGNEWLEMTEQYSHSHVPEAVNTQHYFLFHGKHDVRLPMQCCNTEKVTELG